MVYLLTRSRCLSLYPIWPLQPTIADRLQSHYRHHTYSTHACAYECYSLRKALSKSNTASSRLSELMVCRVATLLVRDTLNFFSCCYEGRLRIPELRCYPLLYVRHDLKRSRMHWSWLSSGFLPTSFGDNLLGTIETCLGL